MTDAELLSLGAEAHDLLRSACLESQATLSSRTGLRDAAEAFDCLALWLEPRADVADAWAQAPLAASCMFIIATDPDAYRALLSEMPHWTEEQRDSTTISGAWRLDGFLKAVYDDNDYSVIFKGDDPRLTVGTPSLNPATLFAGLRDYAVRVAATTQAPRL